MQSFKHVVELDYHPTFRSEKVAGMFDVQISDKLRREWLVQLPIDEKPWSVGLIVGASGAGKTQLANHIWPGKVHQEFKWTASCFLDDFDENLEIRDITETLSKVGFSSPPQWLLPYRALSNGQKFRAELARALLQYEGLFVFDEFTSVIDRQVAQIGSFAFQKTVRKTGKQVVCVTCHYDVEPWLEPDWVFDVSSNSFRWGSLRRPSLTLEVCRVHHSAWDLFKEHHYLTASLNKAAACYVGLIDGRPVVFDAWLPFVGRISSTDTRKGYRGHRTVCLPDFQGLGFGNQLFTLLARMWSGLGYRVFSATTHPAEINKRIASGEWRCTGQGRSGGERKVSPVPHFGHATNRLIARFEFIGRPMPREQAVLLHGG
jgi:energy-coupling factor transporter ATP-binding protein EcfA2